MEAELYEIHNFYAQYPPFDTLPEDVLAHIAEQTEITYFRADTPILNLGDNVTELFMIRSGVVEIHRRNGELYNRLDEGDIFGQMGLLMNGAVRVSVTAVADSLLYCLPKAVFDELCDRFDHFADFVAIEDNARLRQAVSTNESDDLTTSKVTTLISHAPVIIDKDSTIQFAAKQMQEEKTSHLLIMDQESPEEGTTLVGLVTDRDLCIRALAEGVSLDTPISEIMSTELRSLDHNAYVYEAMMTMLRYHVYHVPILKNNIPIGVIEATDIIRYESQHSLLLVSQIAQQQSIDELAHLAEQVKDSFVRLVNEDANSHMIGSAMSVIGRTFKQRIIELAEVSLGPPPVDYCFLALGSMARDEQLIVTDQDNALILDNTYDAAKHSDYFEQFAQFVCDGLSQCGYKMCTGNIMATNPMWRMTRRQWQECFSDWINKPNPQALLHSSIFFDLEGVYGRLKWAEQLNKFIVQKAQYNNKFLACLARNALKRTPPLGFFKHFVMEKDGRHNNSINLKRRGTGPLADLIRVHALAVGSTSRNSFERLDDIIEARILPKGKAQDLCDSMEFISMVRIRHQALNIANQTEPDNNIEPENLTDFERRNLKDAFQILSNAQNFLKFRYQANQHFI